MGICWFVSVTSLAICDTLGIYHTIERKWKMEKANCTGSGESVTHKSIKISFWRSLGSCILNLAWESNLYRKHFAVQDVLLLHTDWYFLLASTLISYRNPMLYTQSLSNIMHQASCSLNEGGQRRHSSKFSLRCLELPK